MSITKKFTKYVMAPAVVATLGMTTLTASFAHADAVAFGKASNFVSNIEAGTYTFDNSTLDKTQIENLLNKEYFRQNDRDLRFVQETLDRFDKKYRRFLETYVKEGLGNVVAQQFYEYHEFVLFVNDFNAAKQDILTQIELVGVMVDSLPGGQQAAGGQQIPAPIRAEVDALVAGMKSAVQAAIDFYVKSHASKNITVDFEPTPAVIAELRERDIPVDTTLMSIQRSVSLGDALNLDFGDVPSFFPPEYLQDIREAANEVRNGNDDHENKKEDFVQWIRVNSLNQYRRECGEEQGWRWTSESEKGVCHDLYQDIVKAFFYRSYLRNMMNIPLGIIGVEDYEERFASWDRFAAPTNVLALLEGGVVVSPGETIEDEKDYRQYLDVVEERAGALFDGDAGIIGNIQVIYQRAMTGTDDLAKVNANVVKLLAADAYEENQIIRRAAGKTDRQDYFRARWFNGDQKDYFIEQFKFMRDFMKDGGSSIVGGVQEGSIQEVLQDISVLVNDIFNRQARSQEMLAFVLAEENKGKAGAIRQEVQQDADDFLNSLGD